MLPNSRVRRTSSYVCIIKVRANHSDLYVAVRNQSLFNQIADTIVGLKPHTYKIIIICVTLNYRGRSMVNFTKSFNMIYGLGFNIVFFFIENLEIQKSKNQMADEKP